ncbi:MarR family winged helix-turn-helix transcriptional regulator [Actinacidiphila sp. ITFR-21]|uniref:MarR family winged helix-turn-helix transcriptional regulator n=1 Tax=Actinacidiphila sp. ITFR-21 TaxID=3075199 RepID=UPI002889ECF8|nr:MarR family transcriptional regulator [Streptomyces sp. ITFR-21]WNI16807.1 MarR family transcriptional regulator [Streptomyces sp. ITFR-21]
MTSSLASPEPPSPDSDEALRLENQLCFAVHAASRAYDGIYRTLLKDTGLTYPQYLVMLVLWQHGPLAVKKLGTHLRLDSGTLSPLVRRLESAGLVRRERSTHDERSVIVRLTPTGQEMRTTIDGVPLAIAKATGLTRAKAKALLDELNALTASLENATA